MALLGIDLGSGSCKAVMFDENGAALAEASRAYTPLRAQAQFAELPPDTLFDALVQAVRAAAAQSPEPPTAMAVSSHGESYVPVLPDGSCCGNLVMNSDNRAAQEAAFLERTLGREEIYDITGTPPHAMFALPKILWHKQRGLYPAGTRFLSAGDYILSRLGLGCVTDYSLASRFLGFDIRKKNWSDQLLRACELSPSELPEAVAAGTAVGILPPEAARLLGLPADITVCVGGHDQPCSALGSGVVAPGSASVSAGSYECVALSSDAPRNTPEALRFHLNSYCHVALDQYITLAFFPAGIVVRWFVEQFCAADAAQGAVYDVLADAVARLPGPTGICVTPHLIGACNPHWNVHATLSATGLTAGHTRQHLYKAIYEGISCELAQNLQVLEALCGPIDALRVSGGGVRAPFTQVLRAAITGKPLSLLGTNESVCLGAAMLAGVGAGLFTNTAQAAARMTHIRGTTQPDQTLGAAYEGQKKQYQLLYPALSPLWPAQADQ